MSRHNDDEIPAEVIQFIKNFDQALQNKDIAAQNTLWETTMPALKATYFNNYHRRGQERQPFKSWPNPKNVSKLFNTPTMEKIYNMIYYTHMYTDRNVANNIRVKSWANFQDLIQVLLTASTAAPNSKEALDLPNGLLFDIFDEMLFELQSLYNQRGNRTVNKDTKDWPEGCWDIAELFKLFDSIIADTDAVENLSNVTDAQTYLTVSGPKHVSRSLGIFALVAKMRLNLMLGDYVEALDNLKPLNIFGTGRQITTQAAPCHVNVYYHVGFCYMMLRRYSDACSTLKLALQVKAANRSYVDKIQAHAVSLINMSSALGCLSVDEVNEGFGVDRTRQEEDAQLLGVGDLGRYREMFLRASPKFLSLPGENGVASDASGQEGLELQCKIFMRAVEQQVDALKLRGYLRVYSTINGSKIQSLLSSTTSSSTPTSSNPELLANAQLACLKQKSSEIAHDGKNADLNTGSEKSTATIDFGIKVDHVTVVHRKHTETPSRRFVTLLNGLKD